MTSSDDRPTTDRFIPPMLATLVKEPFDDPAWLYEVKWDGFRVEAVVGDGDVRLWTRGRQDAAGYFGPFLSPATWLTSTDAILDGEVIALDRHGEPDFALLQSQIRRRGVAPEGARVVYQAFDLLWLDGESLLDLPLEERKARLKAVLRDDPRVRYSDHVARRRHRILRSRPGPPPRGDHGQGARLDLRARTARRDLAQGQVRPEQELVVVGWTTGKGYAADLGALLVAVYDDGRLRYVGKVGAGFTGDTRTDLLARLAPLAAPSRRPTAHRPAASAVRRAGSGPSWSSEPSSQAGRAMARSARPRTRAWTSATIRARSSARRRPPDRRASRWRSFGYDCGLNDLPRPETAVAPRTRPGGSTMKAYALPGADQPAALIDIPEPELPADGIRVRVHAASVNGFDVFQAGGYLSG